MDNFAEWLFWMAIALAVMTIMTMITDWANRGEDDDDDS